MTCLEPIALTHSWPLLEQSRYFELGHVLSCAVTDLVAPREVGALGLHHAGCWECDLRDNELTWSGGVYDIFGLPRNVPITREECVSRYSEGSRAKMERLRAYAIKHRRGFTLDVEIRPAVGEYRWVRLIAAPVLDGGRPVRLHGMKLIV
ncbi:MAG TPA: PAS domain-containing protein [Sphingomicrobium sp.]|jgi:PAS domain-containing protein|nr:PAS domain-containing protein [Sphingomicrobium sp.]